jgi:serine/threonine protein kinase
VAVIVEYTVNGHPDLTLLRRFVAGRLAEEEATEVAEHLEGCEACVEQLEAQPEEDALVDELRACALPEEAAAPDLRGRRVGRYELLEELGRGGMGVVYRAFDPRLKRDIALKLILAGEYADAEKRLRLRQEAEAIAALQHPGIVQVHDVGEADGFTYLALELLHPGGLHLLTGKGRRSQRWTAALMRQIAETLEHAHAAGFIHRDLKPENLLLAPSDDPLRLWPDPETLHADQPPRVKITDFGLCKPLDDDPRLTRAGVMLGTPDYMAPEQAPDSDAPVGAAADIFALGAILYELLAGEPPFHRDSMARQLKSLRDDEPRRPRTLVPGISRELESICLKCLEKEPARRYASARELADDLGRFLEGQPVLARPLTPWRRLVGWARRKPLLAGHLCIGLSLYLLHLFARWVMEIPEHVNVNPKAINLVFASWLAAAWGIEWIRQQPGRQRLAEFLFILLPLALFQTEHWLGTGPDETFIALFVLCIPGAALIRPEPRMIGLATLATLASYNLFAAIKHHQTFTLHTLEHILFFNIILLTLALVIYLLLRRIDGSS